MASREAAVTSQVQLGPEGLEPSPRWLRARHAAANTWIPIERTPVGPAGVEPTPYRLKGEYAAITPRPRIRRERIGFSGYRRAMFLSPEVVRGGIAPATDDVSDRHASVTPPDQLIARSGVEPLSPA